MSTFSLFCMLRDYFVILSTGFDDYCIVGKDLTIEFKKKITPLKVSNKLSFEVRFLLIIL